MNKITEADKWKNLDKFVFNEGRNGNIILVDIEGNLHNAGIGDFVNQPIEGILYDLDLLPEAIEINSWDNLRRHACYMVIKYLKKHYVKEIKNE